jgi:autotransporter passenger strand-loop-strand repeat protein/probable HAF family extracellular repeat protein
MSTALSYETIDPPGSPYSFAEGINKQEQIVGFFQNSNGQEYGFLDSGGTYTTIEFPGSVETGGTSSATTISGGGTEYVYSGGYDFGTIINSSVGSAGRLIKTRSHRIGRVTRCCLGAISQRRPMRGRIVVRANQGAA